MSKVKICGLSRLEDIEAVNNALPDFIGFVFAPSRRRVDVETAAGLKEKLDPRIEAAGIFVNECIEVIVDIVANGLIDIVQLHGEEDDGYIKKLKNACCCRVIRAVGIGRELPELPVQADYLLFDTLSRQRGGTGKTFDWDVIRDYNELPYFLAGGLNTGNAEVAVKTLKPFCVDVSSGVETDGIKDAEKIARFTEIIRRV